MDMDVEAMLEAPFHQQQQTAMEVSRNGMENGTSDRQSREFSEKRRSDKHYRDRSSSRSSRHRHRSISRSRRSSKDRHGGGHPSRDHRRSRSRDREYNRTHRTRSFSRERRHRSPSRERRRRSRSPSAQSRYSDRRTRTPSPMLSEEERDKRTVFVMQLAARLRNRELIEFFSQAGRVRDAKIIADRNTRRSKGVGYVEFHDIDSVPKAIAMTGQKLLGIPIIVQLTEAEKNRIAEQAAQAASQKVPEIAYHRLYVGSIHFNLTEDDLRQIFEPFGPVEFVNLHRDPETGRSRGFAFIQYQNPDDAKQALEKMNGFELAGRNLKVGLVTDKNSGVNFSLDDGDGNGLTLNSQSRVELMQKLAARENDFMNTATPSKQTIEQVRPAVSVAITSKTLVLKNMFNPAEETEPHWIQELEGDVKEECSTFGQVLHIAIDENSLGDVYLKFDSTESAQRAVAGLNGRWFGGKQIEAKHVSEMWYNAKFS